MFDENNNNFIPENTASENAVKNFSENGDFTSSVYEVEPLPKKKKGKKIAIITSASAAVLVGGGIAAYSFSPFVKNQVKLRTLKPDKYYAWVTEENAESFADEICGRYEDSLKRMKSGTKASLSLEYELTDEAREYLKEESSHIDKLPLDNIDSVGLSIGASSKSGNLIYSLGVSVNGDDLMTTDTAFDLDEKSMYVNIPELNENWLSVTLESLTEDLVMSEDRGNILDAYFSIFKDPGKFLSPSELKKELIRYTNVWNDSISDVSLEKSEEIEICDIDVKYTSITIDIDKKLAEKIAENFIEELRDDKIIKGIMIDKLALIDEEEFNKELDDILDDIHGEPDIIVEEETDDDDDYNYDHEDDDLLFREEKKDEFKPITLTTYVDAKGKIRGVKAVSDDESTYFIVGKKGKEVRGLLSIDEKDSYRDVTEHKSAELYANETSKDIYDGNIKITYTDLEFNEESSKYENVDKVLNVEFSDFEIVNKDRNTFNADVKISGGDLEDEIKLSFNGSKNSQKAVFDIISDGKDYGKITLSVKCDDDPDISLPDKENSVSVDLKDRNNGWLSDYTSKEEVKTLAYDVLVKIGFDKSDAEEMADEFAAELFSQRNYYIDDDDLLELEYALSEAGNA